MEPLATMEGLPNEEPFLFTFIQPTSRFLHSIYTIELKFLSLANFLNFSAIFKSPVEGKKLGYRTLINSIYLHSKKFRIWYKKIQKKFTI